jgi:hypothetical protein
MTANDPKETINARNFLAKTRVMHVYRFLIMAISIVSPIKDIDIPASGYSRNVNAGFDDESQ